LRLLREKEEAKEKERLEKEEKKKQLEAERMEKKRKQAEEYELVKALEVQNPHPVKMQKI
jgi:hypothetical protein